MDCTLLSQSRPLFAGQVELIAAKSVEGEFEIMPGHAPLIAMLAVAPLRIKTTAEEHIYAVRHGLLQVSSNQVLILTEEAILPEEINREQVMERRAKIMTLLQSAIVEKKTLLTDELSWLEAQLKVKRVH
jgi:F-type H+-transporting ATPase subunit epsilon